MFNNGDVQWEITPQKELHLKFTNNEEWHEVNRQMDLIPESLGPKRRGQKIIIPVPSEFTTWLRGDDILAAQLRERMDVGKSRQVAHQVRRSPRHTPA